MYKTDQKSSSFFEVLDNGCHVFNNSSFWYPLNVHALLDKSGIHTQIHQQHVKLILLHRNIIITLQNFVLLAQQLQAVHKSIHATYIAQHHMHGSKVKCLFVYRFIMSNQWWANPNHNWDLNHNPNTFGNSIWITWYLQLSAPKSLFHTPLCFTQKSGNFPRLRLSACGCSEWCPQSN